MQKEFTLAQEKAKAEIAFERSKLGNDARLASATFETQKSMAQQSAENQRSNDAERIQIERQCIQVLVASETLRLSQTFEAHKIATEKSKLDASNKMKAEHQNALAQQLVEFLETLSQRAVMHIARQDNLTAMKTDCQHALAQQLSFFQETLNQKEVAQLAAHEEYRNVHETEKQKVRLLASDKESLQR